MKALVAASYLAAVVYLFALWSGEGILWQRIAGLCLQIAAAGLFNWARKATLSNRFTAAFDTDEPKFLVKDGPYRFIRHPFYVSYILFWFGSSLAANSLSLWVLCLVLISVYVTAALLEEKKFKKSPFADDYALYTKRTGFFFPRILAFARQSRPEGQLAPRDSVSRGIWRREPRA